MTARAPPAQVKHQGTEWTSYREIKILRNVDHPNVVKLIDVFAHRNKVRGTRCADPEPRLQVHLVFELCVADLEVLIKDQNLLFQEADIKAWMDMILRAVQACHERWILHRDIKSNNFLIGPCTRVHVYASHPRDPATDNRIKLTDFGLAREYGSPERQLSPGVVTMYYRPPELLYGATEVRHRP